MKWPPPLWLVATCVALVGAIVFAPAITGGWIYDDRLLIAGNQYVHSFSDWPHWFLSDFWNVSAEVARTPGRIAYWRPAVSATYALDWTLGGGAPAVFHVTNLLWHALVGGLAFLVLRRWVGAAAALGPALLATLLFVVHPTKAESVAWISGRTDVICMVAVLLATQGVARRLRGQHGGIVLEAAGTVLAYTSKEQAIILPAFVMIEAWVAAARPPLEWRGVLGLLRTALPQILIAVAYLVARAVLLPIKAVEMERDALSLLSHVLLVLETVGRFAALTFVPHGLSVQHGLVTFVDGERIGEPAYVVLGAIALIVLVVTGFLLRKRMPGVSLGIAFFLVTLAPTMNIVNTQMVTLVSERFLYLPMFGIALAAGSLLASRPHRWLSILFAVAIVGLSVQAVRRAGDFADESTFWERELALHPASGEARRLRIREAFLEKRFRTALRETLELNRKANLTQDVAVAVTVADLVARLTPDRDRRTLEVIDAFCRDMLERKQPEAVLQLPALDFRILTGSATYERDIISQELSLLGLRSTLQSRLGDDKAALAMAQAGVDKCSRCETALVTAALALARGSLYDEADALLSNAGGSISAAPASVMRAMIARSRAQYDHAQATTGPDQLRARAAALAALELWGRAFEVLEPYKDEIKLAPRFAVGFAELAYRAGEPEVAREVLTSAMDPDEIERTFAAWARTMGWDEPRDSQRNAAGSAGP